MLIAPSWGGMLNGLLTLRGAWDRVREDPILKFLVVAVTAYGMSTFEGPMLSFKSVNALSHFTDWTIAHVHVGGLGWNGFMIFGIFYWLVPKIFQTKIYSKRLANFHFWIGTLGIIVYVLPMYWAGFTQSLMWKQFDADGYLVYGNFLETVTQLIPMYQMRALGGLMYFAGVIVMAYNLIATARQGSLLAYEEASAPPMEGPAPAMGTSYWHRWLEARPRTFIILTFIAIAIGGAAEIIPQYLVKTNVSTIESVQPYTPLELAGRDIYIEEGCVGCHSQMIRPFRSETKRYGEYSKAGEYVYDFPFLWGSKRTGPDLLRVGGKYNNSWHFNHMYDPRITSPGSIMPQYPHMTDDDLDYSDIPKKITVLRSLGVPYPDGYEDQAIADLEAQAQEIVDDLATAEIEIAPNKKIIAMIAYLQRLGTDIKVKPEQVEETEEAETAMAN